MYGKIFNRLSQGCHRVKEPSRRVPQRRQILTTTPALRLDKEFNNNQVWIKPRASGSCKRLNLPPSSEDVSSNSTPSSDDKTYLKKSRSFCSEKDYQTKLSAEIQSKLPLPSSFWDQSCPKPENYFEAQNRI